MLWRCCATPRLLTRSRRLLASPLPLVIVGLRLFQAQPADAARGGRREGRFRAPSMPRSGGSYGGGYRGGIAAAVWASLIIPIFAAGRFGLLILMAIAGVLVNAVRGSGGIPLSAAAQRLPCRATK